MLVATTVSLPFGIRKNIQGNVREKTKGQENRGRERREKHWNEKTQVSGEKYTSSESTGRRIAYTPYTQDPSNGEEEERGMRGGGAPENTIRT